MRWARLEVIVDGILPHKSSRKYRRGDAIPFFCGIINVANQTIHWRNMKHCLSLLAVLFWNQFVFGAVDFTVEVSGSPQITTMTPSQKFLEIPIKVNNIGEDGYEGKLRIKGYLLPSRAYPATSELNSGMVLGYTDLTVSLSKNESHETSIRYLLPTIRKEKYLIGFIVNSNSAVPSEKNELNNLSDLVEVGEVEVESSRKTGIDLYTEVAGSFLLYDGIIQHIFRTILKGPKTVFPSHQYSAKLLWARFFAVDLETKKAFTLNYSKQKMDKNWGSIQYSTEKDSKGEMIFVDYYTQKPSIDTLPPANYQFVALTNLRDLIPEDVITNNLEAKPFAVRPIMVDQKEVRLVRAFSGPDELTATVLINNPYSKSVHWTATIDPTTPWLTAPITSGDLKSAPKYFTVMATAKNLPAGKHRGKIEFQCEEYPNEKVILPVLLTRQSQTAPIIGVNQGLIELESKAGRPVKFENLIVSNNGTAVLEWAATPSSEWLTINSTAGQIGPKANSVLAVSAAPRGLRPGTYSAKISIASDAQSAPTIVNVNLRVRL